jgi:hypothetical protein
MKTIAAIFFFVALLLPAGLQAQTALLVDKQATRHTSNLFHQLQRLRMKGTLFGHQDDLAYGFGWKYEKGRSDIKDVTGDYPAVYGWDLGHLELDRPVNLDSVPFDRMKQFIREAYERGGVITISWHLNNPFTGKSAWHPEPGTVKAILPGGEKNGVYASWLDKVAAFLADLKGSKGEAIPVIFRPFHELNGSWFWWGKNHCTPDEFRELWRFTVSYLRDEKQLHHLLYAFNTDRFYSREEYLERYPGDEWVDVIGFDIYQRDSNHEQFIQDFDRMLTRLENIANEKKKIPALTEFGYGNLPDSTWWTNVFGKVLSRHKMAWVLAWRNAGRKYNGTVEFYVPYKGHPAAADFRKFYNEAYMLFQEDVTREKLYE